jgi:hypothetical protein
LEPAIHLNVSVYSLISANAKSMLRKNVKPKEPQGKRRSWLWADTLRFVCVTGERRAGNSVRINNPSLPRHADRSNHCWSGSLSYRQQKVVYNMFAG